MGLFDTLAGLGGSLIGAGASIYGAQTAADAAKKAGKLEWQQYQDSRADLAPYREAGGAALSNLRDILINGNADSYTRTPGYDFRMAEGQKAIDRSAASRGNLMSGSTLKALTRYGQGVASDEYTNNLNRLFNLAGYGQTATNTTAGLGADAARGYGNAIQSAGNLRGSGYALGGTSLANNLLGQYGYNYRGY